jgi:uncharacterized membrane protein YwaF
VLEIIFDVVSAILFWTCSLSLSLFLWGTVLFLSGTFLHTFSTAIALVNQLVRVGSVTYACARDYRTVHPSFPLHISHNTILVIAMGYACKFYGCSPALLNPHLHEHVCMNGFTWISRALGDAVIALFGQSL